MSGSSIFFDNRSYTKVNFVSDGTFVVPTGINLVFAEMHGAGGGGAHAFLSSEVAGGGQAGNMKLIPLSVNPGETVTVSLGVGGAGISAKGTGLKGGDTTVSGSFGISRVLGGNGGIFFDTAPPPVLVPISPNSHTQNVFFSEYIDPKDGINGTGGSSVGTWASGGTSTLFAGGGHGGIGNGGNAVNGPGTAGSGGTSAGGGGVSGTVPSTSGSGGNGYVSIYYRL